jgi:predicted nucleic acid-binding protein
VRIFVIDASVVTCWFLPTPDRAAAGALLERRWTYMAPESLVVELGRVLERALRRGRLLPGQARDLVATLTGIAVDTVPCQALATDAWAIATCTGLPASDALYLTLAARLETKVLTTSDRLLRGVSPFPALSALVHDVRAGTSSAEPDQAAADTSSDPGRCNGSLTEPSSYR